MSNGAPPDARPTAAGESAVAADDPRAGGRRSAARPGAAARAGHLRGRPSTARTVSLGGPRQRAVLARVLVGDGDAVPAEQIVEDVWGEQAAGGSSASTCTSTSPGCGARWAARPSCAATAATCWTGAWSRWTPRRFVADVARGRRMLARGDDEGAARVLEGALDRWVGPRVFGELADVPFLAITDGPAGGAAGRAPPRRWPTRTPAAAGPAGDVALLEELAARDPLRESLALRLVTALYAAGRQADALAAFERCRRSLADQLGRRPGAAAAPGARRGAGPGGAAGCRRGEPQPAGQPAAAQPLVHRPDRAARRGRPAAGRRRAPAARGGAVRAGRHRQDRAGARGGLPPAPGGPGGLVDRRRRPGAASRPGWPTWRRPPASPSSSARRTRGTRSGSSWTATRAG